MHTCLAIDIGASGGRHILGKIIDGRLVMREVYRFENGIEEKDGTLTWNIDKLSENIIRGIEACRDAGEIPDTLAIDTWGVDYVLIDSRGKPIYPCVAYRDSRNEAAIPEVEKLVSFDEMYEKTGIQKAGYNTVYQLMCDKMSGKLEKAENILLMPDYFSYVLTGVMKNEYTMASTSSLVNAKTRQWDMELIGKLGYPKRLFKPLCEPGTSVGRFSPEIEARVGFSAEVLFCPAHDTASAVGVCPIDENSVYISSGTWSLVGTEIDNPVTTPAAKAANFANEGAGAGKYCFLKNIMGMWLFQNLRRELGSDKYSYDDMMHMAMGSSYDKAIDPTDNAFLAPKSMIEAIRAYLGEEELPTADVLRSVYLGLARSYKKTVDEIISVTGKKVSRICIVGGGSRDEYLNRLTREITGCQVSTGPTEGTAAGNILSQIMAKNSAFTPYDARKC
ncbi:MAG: rhamnulokinase, partial [Oscillospiraceae bacterium]|nr:rhamnulokinase [Oscillospiraceae bacterium]